MAAWPKQVWSSESMQQSCLMPLSACSDASEKDLREQLSKAERLLKLGELCRKLEREREKVLPFHTLDEAVPISALPSHQAVQASRKAAGTLP